MENKLRTIVIGDVHGCIDEFNELIKLLSYNKKNDRLILLGDLLDRGPDSVAVIKKAREMDLECILGNHEAKYLKWFNSSASGKNIRGKQEYYNNLSVEDSNYIFHMPLSLKIDNTILVHAGVRSDIPLEKQTKDDLCYMRYSDINKKFISLKKIWRDGIEATGAHFWSEFWTGPESIIYGHHVHSLISPLIEEVQPNVFCYGIDTGCCFGGRLSAIILETKEIIQVQAKQIYYKQGFNT